MTRQTLALLSFSMLSTLLLALVAAMLAMWVWALWRLWRGIPLLAEVVPIPRRETPWGAVTVFLVIVLYLAVNMSVTALYSAVTGRRSHAAAGGPAAPLETPKPALPEDSAKPETTGQDRPADGRPHQSQEEVLFQLAIINVILLLIVPSVLHATSRARLADLGVGGWDWRRQLAVGVGAALLLTPGVYAIQSLAVRLWRPRAHPVEEMVLERFSIEVAILALVSTVVLAPMIEELLFRGVLQSWLCRLFSGQVPTPAADASPAGVLYHEPVGQPDARVPNPSPVTWQPGECAADRKLSRSTTWASELSVLVTSVFFAALHMPQWPAPVAIFILSVALGSLYARTGSLRSAIAMHGTFNGFSTLLLLWEALGRQISHLS
jgi:membrane protease YdiL (CAAX protease family)